MEISIMPTFTQITWIVRDFFDLSQENGFYLDSPEFLFNGDNYCMRLYPRVNNTNGDKTEFHVRRLSVTFPERRVSCKVAVKWRERNGDESYNYETLSLEENDSYSRSVIEEERDVNMPDGSFTLVCNMCVSQESRAGSSTQGQEEQLGFPGDSASFSSNWSSHKMELSSQSPCTYVLLSVPNVFELLRETGGSLDSPEFRFAGDNYCLRFHPSGDKADTELQLVRLTSTFPERTILYRVAYGLSAFIWDDWLVYPSDSRSLVGKIGFCLSRSKMEEKIDRYVISGTFYLLLFLQQSSSAAGTSDAAQKLSGLRDIEKLQSDYRQLLQKETESDACFVVCGKEFRAHRVVLRSRSTVFEAMFGHDTAEKESGRVIVDDLDPDIFADFLEYLYTGNIGSGLSDDNVFGLYVVADKYEVSTLLSKCVEHMRRNLSVDSFCDALSLALRHHEKDLLLDVISFFKANLQHIIITVKWQQFVLDNGTAANELFIKALVPGKQ